MERILDNDESSRKAREIYSRRNIENTQQSSKKYFRVYKFLFQFLVLINLSIVFVAVCNRNYIFSEEFLNRVNELFNIYIYQNVNNFFTEESVNEIKAQKEEVTLQNITECEEKAENENLEEAKESYSFIKPVDGTITSFFGDRESKNPNVSKYHTGIDVVAQKDTIIKASISGVVSLVSDIGNYGKHLKIKTDDYITVYAHCNEILVKEGQFVEQGEAIAKVGSTGNSTGPHLHFEIRKNEEYLNPIEFFK